jgi:tetratricopeptide (TPR) repeat protein
MTPPPDAAPPEPAPQIPSELMPLLRLLTLANGFALAFLESNVPVESERLAAQLGQALEGRGRRGRVLRLEEPEEDLLGRLRGLDPPLAAGEALFVLGFERAIPSGVEYPPALTRLNRAREHFRELPCPLVLVLPRYALDQLSREAPDFWAWRSGVFEARVEKGRLEALVHEMTAPSLGLYENLSEARKREHLEVAEGLLAELGKEGKGWERERADLYRRRAALLLPLGRWGEALDAAARARELAQQAGDARGEMQALMIEGAAHLAQGRPAEARGRHRRALAVAEELADEAGIAGARYELGRVAQALAEYPEAREEYGRAMALEEKLGNRRGVAAACFGLGNVAYLTAELAEAREWYHKALLLGEELGNRAGRAAAHHQLARLAVEEGALEEALAGYRKSLALAEELGDKLGMALNYTQIALLLGGMGRVEEAVSQCLPGFAIYRDLGVPEPAAIVQTLALERRRLGATRFRELVAGQLGEATAAEVLAGLDRHAPSGARAKT